MSPRKAYETELVELDQLVEKMAKRTSEAIELAVESFEKLDLDLAEKVREID